MRHLHFAELRDSWGAWLSVSLTFIAVNAMYALFALVDHSEERAAELQNFDEAIVMTNKANVVLNQTLITLVGLLVIGTVTTLVINSRRGSLARLQLAGAAPGQIVSTLMSQLAVVSVASAVVGDLVALPLVQVTLNEQSINQEFAHMDAVYAVGPMLTGNLATIAAALLGGLRVARRATRIPPVEALRQSQAQTKRPNLWLRGFGSLVLVGFMVLAFVAAPKAKHIDDQKIAMQIVMQVAMMLIPLSAMVLTWMAPALIGPLTRAWTALLWVRSGTWHLARNTVIGKIDRLIHSAVPSMLTLGLLFAMATLGESFEATWRAMGGEGTMSGTTLSGLLLVLGAPLLIAIAGSLSSLLIMGRQREAELALDGILGATPLQRVLLPALEGLIITVTALLQALAMLGVLVGFMKVALPVVVPNYQVAIPWSQLGLVTLVVGLATVATTLLPTLRSLNTPAPRVIARYVAA